MRGRPIAAILVLFNREVGVATTLASAKYAERQLHVRRGLLP